MTRSFKGRLRERGRRNEGVCGVREVRNHVEQHGGVGAWETHVALFFGKVGFYPGTETGHQGSALCSRTDCSKQYVLGNAEFSQAGTLKEARVIREGRLLETVLCSSLFIGQG